MPNINNNHTAFKSFIQALLSLVKSWLLLKERDQINYCHSGHYNIIEQKEPVSSSFPEKRKERVIDGQKGCCGHLRVICYHRE